METKTVTVVIVRHPDSSTDYSAYASDAAIDVKFVTADLGSSFNGSPEDEDEAEIALEIAETLTEGVAHLPDHSETRQMALSWAESLRSDASEYIDVPGYHGYQT